MIDDVLVIGEVLVELSTTGPLLNGDDLRLGFSRDAPSEELFPGVEE